MQLVCPLCRGTYNGAFRYWSLRVQPGLLRCTNPTCVGRYATEPFPIVLREPGAVVDRLLDLPDPLSLSALAMQLQSLPEDSLLLDILSRRSTYLWSHFHDLLPETYRPDFVHPAPFAIRALALLDQIELHPRMRVLVAGCSVGREALEMAYRLGKVMEESGAASAEVGRPVVAADIDPAVLRVLMTLQAEGRTRVMLRASVDGWHSPDELMLPEGLRRWSGLVQPLCCDLLDPPFAAEDFDLIIGLNVLDNVTDPLLLLGQFNALLKPGGHLLLATPFAWRADITPRANRPAAAVRHARRTEQELLQEILTGRVKLSADFKFTATAMIPRSLWSLRIHDTHYQSFMPMIALWQKAP